MKHRSRAHFDPRSACVALADIAGKLRRTQRAEADYGEDIHVAGSFLQGVVIADSRTKAVLPETSLPRLADLFVDQGLGFWEAVEQVVAERLPNPRSDPVAFRDPRR